MAKGLLKRNRRHLTEPAVRLGLFPGGQQCGRLTVAQALTRFGVVGFASIKRSVVDDADATKRASKIVLLLGRGVKTISKTRIDHVLKYRSYRRVFPLTCRRRRSRKGRGACCIPPMNQGVLAPPSNSPFSITPNPVAWLLFEKVWEYGCVGVWGGKPLSHPQPPTHPYLNYAPGFGINHFLE